MLFGDPEKVRAEQIARLEETTAAAAETLPGGDTRESRALARAYFCAVECTRAGAKLAGADLERTRRQVGQIARRHPGGVAAALAAVERYARADAALFSAQMAETAARHEMPDPGPAPRSLF